MKSRAVPVLLLALGLSLAWADQGECEWQTFRVRDGLVRDFVTSIAEDRSGALWFGTLDYGVSRYDGVSWRTFTTADGLASDGVSAILGDRNGSMWVATYPGGVSRYDGVNWRTFTTADGLANNVVNVMFEDRNGALWFGTDDGVSRYDGVNWRTFTRADGLSNNSVRSIIEDRNGALWFGTDSGVSRYDGVTWRRVGAYPVGGILEDRNGVLWFRTSPGVVRYDGVSSRTFTTADGLASNNVTSMVEDRDGALWFATSAGVSRYDGARWRTITIADGLASNWVFSLHKDQSGALWFATYMGVNRYDGASWHTFTTATTGGGIVGDGIRCMIEDRNGALWFGTSSGVSRYDGASWHTFTTADGLADNDVRCILEDRSGALWFGTHSGGVSRYDGVNWRTYTTADGLAKNYVWGMLEDRNGALWFLTPRFTDSEGGVSRYDGVSWRTFTTVDGLASNDVASILEDRNGVLWFGTLGYGVSRYDGVSWRTFTEADGLAEGYVISILEDRNGALWFGSDGYGASRYDGVNWRTLSAADGLAGNNVRFMIEDRDGALWFATYDGVGRYDGMSWRTFTAADGLASNGVSYMIEDREGALWFVTTGAGVTVHTPDRVAPRTVLLSRPPTASANRIPSISFLAAFGDERVQFQYSLNREPWSDWSPGTLWPSRLLPDGEYDFRVRSRDDYGNVESPPESLFFEIDATPPSPALLFPGPNAALRDSIAIRGTAADARFDYYRLEYRPRGAASWATLVDTTRAPVTDDVLGGWNTLGLPDGKYELRLSVADTLGLVGSMAIPVSVDNQFPYAAQTSPALVTAAEGGDVYTDDAAAHLYLPPHGLSRDTIVTVTALDSTAAPASLPDGAARVSVGYELNWGTVALEKAATLDLAMPMDGAAVVYSAGADAAWQRVGGTVDASTNRITVPVSAPGRYALYREGGVPAPVGVARLSGITLTPRVFSPRGTYASTSLAIGFSLGRPGAVTVKVYNRAGRLVREVASGLALGAGANVVHWDGRDDDGRAAEDGAYLVTIGAFGETQTRALAVVK